VLGAEEIMGRMGDSILRGLPRPIGRRYSRRGRWPNCSPMRCDHSALGIWAGETAVAGGGGR
jgi:hypothetical protein